MNTRSIVQASFTIEKIYPASVERVFAAWADPVLKARWFRAPNDGTKFHRLDFRVGGTEEGSGISPSGKPYRYDAAYRDIVAHSRIVYTYDMHIEGRRISVSLAVVEFKALGDGTVLTVTEHGAFLDGLATVADREHGTNLLFDKLGAALQVGA